MSRRRPTPRGSTTIATAAVSAGHGGALALSVAVVFVVALPLAVNPWGFQQRLPVAWLVVLVLVPLGLAAAIRAEGAVVVARPLRWWLALLVIFAAATIVSVAPLNALIGSPARRLGLIGWVAIALACWWGVHLGRRPGALDAVTRAVVAGSIPVSAIGLIERGERFFSFGSGLDLVRSASTLKNAAFLGAYLCLVIPIALRMASGRHVPKPWRVVAGVAAVTAIVTLAFSQTRAAWLGTLAGVVVLVVGRSERGTDTGDAPGRARFSGRRPTIVVLGAIGLLAVIALTAPVRDRALSVASVGAGSNRARTLLWVRGLVAIGDRPVLGYGPDATLLAYPHVIDARFEREVTRQTLPDRAHTLLLDLTLWGGIPALVAGVGLLLSTARSARPSSLGWMGRGIAAALIAYLVQLGFSFSLADLDALPWLLAGLLLAPLATTVRLPGGFARGVAGLAVVAALAGGLWQVRDVIADRQLRAGADADRAGHVDAAEHSFKAATETASERAQYWQAYGRFERFVAEAANDRTRFERSLAAHRRALQLVPGDTSYGLDEADTLLSMGEAGLADIAPAEASIRSVLKHDPHSARALFALGVALGDQQHFDEARAAWTTAHELVASWSSAPARNLARLADRQGDIGTAQRWFQTVQTIEGNDREATAYLATHPA